MSEPGALLEVRTALARDARSVAAIGRVAFPAVHNDIVGAQFAAAVVEQTYSVEALTDCIARCADAERRVDGPSYYSNTMAIETDEPPPHAAAILMRYTAGSS